MLPIEELVVLLLLLKGPPPDDDDDVAVVIGWLSGGLDRIAELAPEDEGGSWLSGSAVGAIIIIVDLYDTRMMIQLLLLNYR